MECGRCAAQTGEYWNVTDKLTGLNAVGRASVLGRLLAAAALVAVAACSPGRDLPPLRDTQAKNYRLGPGDQIRVITFGEEQLTGDFRVSDTGSLDIPLIGVVPANGLTTSELASEITQELVAKKLFRSPSVSVEVAEYRPIFILGEVSHPGQFPYQPGMTVLSAVAVAGGFTYRAVEDHVSIVRTQGDHAVESQATRQAYLRPGDVVTVFERTF